MTVVEYNPYGVSEKVCTRCGDLKPMDWFYKDKRALDGKTSWCKRCMRRPVLDKLDTHHQSIKGKPLAVMAKERSAERKEAKRRVKISETQKHNRHLMYKYRRAALRKSVEEYLKGDKHVKTIEQATQRATDFSVRSTEPEGIPD